MAPTTRVTRSWPDCGEDDDQLVLLQRPRPGRKYKSMVEIMRVAKRVQLGNDDVGSDEKKNEEAGGDDDDDDDDDDDGFGKLGCEECGRGDKENEILLCDECDKGYHLDCLRPIMPRVPFGPWYCPSCSDHIRPRRPHVRSMI